MTRPAPHLVWRCPSVNAADALTVLARDLDATVLTPDGPLPDGSIDVEVTYGTLAALDAMATFAAAGYPEQVPA